MMHNMWQFKHKIVLLFLLLTSLSTIKADGVDLHKLGHIRHLMGAWGPQHLLTEAQREGFLVWGKLQVANRKLPFLAVNSVPSLVIIGFDEDNFSRLVIVNGMKHLGKALVQIFANHFPLGLNPQ